MLNRYAQYLSYLNQGVEMVRNIVVIGLLFSFLSLNAYGIDSEKYLLIKMNLGQQGTIVCNNEIKKPEKPEKPARPE